jgi:hypothetical protein
MKVEPILTPGGSVIELLKKQQHIFGRNFIKNRSIWIQPGITAWVIERRPRKTSLHKGSSLF